MGGRYILNTQTNVIHDRQDADERCNVDDIGHPRRTSDDPKDLITPGTHFCKWCMARRRVRRDKKEAASEPAPSPTPPEPPYAEPAETEGSSAPWPADDPSA